MTSLLAAILDEIDTTAQKVSASSLIELAEAITAAPRVFVLGEGRSGLVGRMLAMRLMHLGRVSHFVGESTCPSIAENDLLIAISGSGSTGVVTWIAQRAVATGARLLAITAAPDSPLAQLSATTIEIPAAKKTDHSGARSRQFAGSLFEQTALVMGDAVFEYLRQKQAADAESLWARHSNLE